MTTRKRILAITVALALGAAGASAVVFGGLPNVAGTDEHTSGVQWLLRTTMQSSVRARAKAVRVPIGIDLDDPQLAQKAYGHYSVACTPCHGAPGVEPAPWMVLNPPATLLTETASNWRSEELFWIIANGIKMTGMPAIGPTHGDEDLWAITAFVQQLPTMTPERYAEMGERHAAARTRVGTREHL
jgi:mono/diheme cytochrome c family protein